MKLPCSDTSQLTSAWTRHSEHSQCFFIGIVIIQMMVGFTLLLSGAKGCWVQPPQHCLCFHMGLNFKLCAVCWAQATRHQAPCMENFHQSPPPMAQLLFYCKISIILQRKGQHALRWFSLPTFATVNSLLVSGFWVSGLSIEKRNIPADHNPSAEVYFLRFMNFSATRALRTETGDLP